ncbi:MAG: 2-hydroxy-3-oxopropionate reductase [Pseudomonadota bacterium]|jgi:3-hydroxyisobutyrate dehydrogenase-like beta-hydroxyacid dehydrogenase
MTAVPLSVGLVGLGLVGTALGQRLTNAGFEVLGFDLRHEAAAAWAAAGGRVAADLPELGARCARVVLAVFDTAGVLQVLEGPGGLLQTGTPAAVVDCSTGDPAALQALARRLAARGVDFIEAPLSGSSQQIADGQATLLLGATPEAAQRHADLLQALSPARVHVGGPGLGAGAKLATNLVLGLNRAALAEGLALAERLGIEPEAFLQLVLATPARSDAALVKGRRMVRGEFEPQSRIRQHLKDVQLMLDAAQAAGQRLPLSTVHAALLQAAVDAGDGDLDNAAIVRQLRRETF